MQNAQTTQKEQAFDRVGGHGHNEAKAIVLRALQRLHTTSATPVYWIDQTSGELITGTEQGSGWVLAASLVRECAGLSEAAVFGVLSRCKRALYVTTFPRVFLVTPSGRASGWQMTPRGRSWLKWWEIEERLASYREVLNEEASKARTAQPDGAASEAPAVTASAEAASAVDAPQVT